MSGMLDEITSIQQAFLSGCDRTELFERLLTVVVEMTDSQYGYIGEVSQDQETGQRVLQTRASYGLGTHISRDETYHDLIRSGQAVRNLDNIFGECVLTGKTVISNDIADQMDLVDMPHGHRPITRFLGVPLFANDAIIGMFGLANRPEDYTKDLVAELTPIISTLSTIITAQRSQRQYNHLITELQYQKNALDEHSIVSITNSRGIITYVNDFFCELTGYSSQELVGKTHAIVNSGHHSKAFWDDMWRTIRSGQTWRGIIRNKKKNGDYYWVKSTMMAHKNRQGKIDRYIAIRTDVTNEIEQQFKLQGAVEEAESANASKSIFIASMNHELRTPINAISGFSQMIEEEAFGPIGSQKYLEYAKDIHTSSQLLNSMIDDILHISQLDSKSYEPKSEYLHLRDVTEELLHSFQPAIDAKQLVVKVDIDEALPEIMNLDKNLVLHLFNNLVSNAIKHTPAEGWVRVVWSPSADSSGLQISVEDSGPGFPQDVVDKVGEPFLMGENPYHARHPNSGTGLGLYITKKIATFLGGNLTIGNTENGGFAGVSWPLKPL
ncbi:sensor histidine kinase [Kordiimonas sediminis]|nr:GAF domain-containing protein [Kordiimonas sediminis]